MQTIIVDKAFLFAEGGNHVTEIETGEQEVSERCALVAVEHLKVATWPAAKDAELAKPAADPIAPTEPTESPTKTKAKARAEK